MFSTIQYISLFFGATVFDILESLRKLEHISLKSAEDIEFKKMQTSAYLTLNMPICDISSRAFHSNKYLIVKIVVDTAENESLKLLNQMFQAYGI